MCRVSTAPTATAGRGGLNWKKFSLSMRSVSQYARASLDFPMDRATSRPANPPPRMRRRFFGMGKEYHRLAVDARGPYLRRHGRSAAAATAAVIESADEFPAPDHG